METLAQKEGEMVAIFKAIKGVLTQGARSANSTGNCKYRGNNNHKCAVGFLIEDEYYYPDLEAYIPGQSIADTENLNVALEKSNNIRMTQEFAYTLSNLQECHDDCSVYVPFQPLRKELNPAEFRAMFIEKILCRIHDEILPAYCADAIEEWKVENPELCSK